MRNLLVVARLPGGGRAERRGVLVDPTLGPAHFDQVRQHVVVVVNRLHHRQQFSGRFSGDREFRLTLGSHIQVAVRNPDRLGGQSADPLDVVRPRPAGKLEDTDFPPLGVAELVGELLDENPVAAVGARSLFLRTGGAVDRVAAHRAGAADRLVVRPLVGDAVDLLAGAGLEEVAALGALQVLVAAEQGGRH